MELTKTHCKYNSFSLMCVGLASAGANEGFDSLDCKQKTFLQNIGHTAANSTLQTNWSVSYVTQYTTF